MQRERWTSQETSNDEQDHTPRTFACGVNLVCENCRVRLKGVLIEQDSKVRVAGSHKELLRDVRDVVTSFLKNNCMKLITGSRNNVSRISARRAWIPLKEGKTKLMMHEITVGCIKITVPFRFGLTKVDQRKNEGWRFRKRASPCTRICIDRIVGSHQSGTGTSLACSG